MTISKRHSFIYKIQSIFGNKKTKRRFFVGSMLFLPIVGFLLFWFYVHLDSFFLAFQRPDPELINHYQFSLDNFERFFYEFSNNGDLPIAFRNTLIFFFTSQFIGFPISILVSYFIYKKIRGHKLFRVILYLPAIITSSALVILFKEALVDGGPISSLCKALNIDYINPFIRTTDTSYMGSVWAIVVYNISFGIGGNIIVLCGSMNSIDKQVLESGQLDGCSWFRELVSIIIPSIWPTVSTILILNFVSILGATGPILAFTKGYNNTTTLSFLMYQYVYGNLGTVGAPDINYASCIGFVMTVITFPIVLIVRRIIFKEDTK